MEPSTTAFGESANKWGYRPQLDGLRAVAVYLVLAYHAGSWRLQGGFVGVDLFFVLSGFLVTNVILAELIDQGHLRLRRFYARRVRRLIPAASLAIVGTSLAALLIANPLDRSSWSGDATASSLWYANWHFIGEANNYFLSDDATSPFQHFWSLSIEEQFYLAFPALLIGLLALTRRRVAAVAAVVAGLLLGGVALQVYWAGVDENRAYLDTGARIYQLLAGVLLALVVWRWEIPAALRRVAGALTLVGLVSFVAVSSSWLDVTPSHRGMLAAACATLLVAAAQTTSRGAAWNLLSWTPVKYLGQISYGTYLWHWPVVVLTLQLVEISPRALFAVSAVIGTALAALSHELVERKLRQSAWFNQRPSVAIIGGVAMAVITGLLIAPAVLESDRRPAITPRSAATTVGAATQPVPDVDWEAARLAPPGAPRCEEPDATDCIVIEGQSGTLLLIGDSHARMYLPAFEYIAEQRDLRLALAYSTSCPWMESSYPGGAPVGLERCLEVRQRTYDDQLAALDPDVVVLAGYPYSLYPDGLRSTRRDLEGMPMPEIFDLMATDSVAELSNDARRIVLIEPSPIFDEDPLTCLSGAISADQCTTPPLLSIVEENRYSQLADADPLVTTLDVDALACPRLPICDPLQRGYPVWRDSNHFTTEFVSSIAPSIEELLDRAGAFDGLG